MKSFKEWHADRIPKPKVILGVFEKDSRLKEKVERAVNQSLEFLKMSPEEDRVEFEVLHYQIKVWRTRVNTVEQYKLGYKSPWEKQYTETTLDHLVELLYQSGY